MPNGNWSSLSLFFAHGLTAALTLYVAVRGGDWLDRHLGTSPLFLVVLVSLVLVANLRLMVKDLMAETEKQDRTRRRGPSDREPRWRGPEARGEEPVREEEEE